MRIKKPKKLKYIPLEELKKINREYLDELETEKARLEALGDKKLIDSFYANLLSTYESRVNLLADECAVDYVIKKTEIRERARELTPRRRCWLWRLLLFVPITNRAQDVIEDRAALDADKLHSEQETENAQGWKELDELYNTDEPKIKTATAAETLDKPQTEPAPVMAGLSPRRPRQPQRKRDQEPATSERAPGVLPGQMNIADVVPADKPAQ